MLERAVAIDQNSHEIHHKIGVAYRMKNQPAQAIKALQKSTQLNPKYLEAHYDHAMIQIDTKNYQLALEPLRQVLQIEPNHAEAKRQLAMLSQ